jgi:hypothetical protein
MSYQAEYYNNQAAGAGLSVGGAATAPQSFDGYTSQEPPAFDVASIQLPPPNMACYQEPPAPRSEVKYLRVEEPPVTKTITQNFNTSKTVVKENVIHHQHVKNVIINVNRNHWHTQRVVVKDNNYHHYLINNVIKVADIHHQKIEQVRGESKTFNDYKQTQRVEPAECVRSNDSASAPVGLSSADEGAVASIVAGGSSASASSYSASATYGSASAAQQSQYNY